MTQLAEHQPFAEDWSVSADGLTYTSKAQKDAKWYTADGGMLQSKLRICHTGQICCGQQRPESYGSNQNSIKGLNDYVTGVTNDFSTVGVKALDDYTVSTL